jgi:LmbE family N-acetylglucosaminyl deacetylase
LHELIIEANGKRERKMKKILAIGAHPDDIELGCGGTLCQLASSGAEIVAVFLTKGEKSGQPKERCVESKSALKLLGVDEVYFGEFPDTEVPSSHKVIDFLEQYENKFKPDIIFTHSANEIHQDHRTVGWLSQSAFRNTSKLVAYESPRVTSNFTPTYFVDITNCINSKWEALKCHSSQKSKRYVTYESVINLASFRGNQVGVVAAEAFEVIKYVERF